jgi:lauroyl/myristoyl acyltransferase
MDVLSVPDEIRIKDKNEKINVISDRIEKGNAVIFIDDFHIADENVRELAKRTRRNLVLSSKKKIGVARNEIHLTGVDEEERDKLIDLIENRLNAKISNEAREKIKKIAEGHPVSTEILVRNYEKINFKKLEEYKQGLNLSNEEHSKEFLKRVVVVFHQINFEL